MFSSINIATRTFVHIRVLVVLYGVGFIFDLTIRLSLIWLIYPKSKDRVHIRIFASLFCILLSLWLALFKLRCASIQSISTLPKLSLPTLQASA